MYAFKGRFMISKFAESHFNKGETTNEKRGKKDFNIINDSINSCFAH